MDGPVVALPPSTGHSTSAEHCSSCGICHAASAFSAGEFSVRLALAGGGAGMAEHLVAFPFDTVKTRMQQQQSTRSTMSFWRTCANMARTEPWRNFFRGWGPVLACSFPAHAAYFSLYETAKTAIGAESSGGYAVASLAATIGHDSVSVPFDVVKQHMQLDRHHHHRSSVDCLRCIVRNHGAISLFKSLPTTVLMNVPHTAVHWVTYESMKKATGVAGNTLNGSAFDLRFVGCGLVAGGVAACASTPLDVVKTRVQLMTSPGMWHAIREITAAEGARGFFKGLVPRVCAIAPSAAVVMTTYEGLKRLLLC